MTLRPAASFPGPKPGGVRGRASGTGGRVDGGKARRNESIEGIPTGHVMVAQRKP